MTVLNADALNKKYRKNVIYFALEEIMFTKIKIRAFSGISLIQASLAVLGLVAAMISQTLFAQTYPQKGVRIIVPFPPGGGTDTMGRALAQHLSNAFGQAFVVENRGGRQV